MSNSSMDSVHSLSVSVVIFFANRKAHKNMKIRVRPTLCFPNSPGFNNSKLFPRRKPRNQFLGEPPASKGKNVDFLP